jgi:hypothetical protein
MLTPVCEEIKIYFSNIYLCVAELLRLAAGVLDEEIVTLRLTNSQGTIVKIRPELTANTDSTAYELELLYLTGIKI